jgi:hypothetical protein
VLADAVESNVLVAIGGGRPAAGPLGERSTASGLGGDVTVLEMEVGDR